MFSRGIGFGAGNYEYLLSSIASMGFAVISLEYSGDFTPEDMQASQACVMSWIGWDHARGGHDLFDGRLTCDVVYAGHSRAGESTWLRVRDRFEPEWAPYMFDFEVRGMFTLGTRHNPGTPLSPELAVPTYVLLGALDNDTGHSALRQFDLTPAEEELVSASPLRLLHMIYGGTHAGFGGDSPMPVADNKSAWMAESGIPRFLDWQVFGNDVEENRRYLLLERFPETLTDPSIWTGDMMFGDDPGYGELTGGAGCALLGDPQTCALHLGGCQWTTMGGGQCVDWPCDDVTTPEPCDARWACAWDDPSQTCVDRPMVFANHTLDTAEQTTERRVVTAFPDTPAPLEVSGTVTTQIDEATDLWSDLNQGTEHSTHVLRVDWGDTSEGTVRVPVVPTGTAPLDISSDSYLSLRLANLKKFEMSPNTQVSCEETQAPVDVGVRLIDDDPDADDAVVMVRLAPQDFRWGLHASSTLVCLGAQAMSTYRIPLSSFCRPGFSSQLTAVELQFADPGFEAQVFVDSIELTRSQYDDHPDNMCASESSMWQCLPTQVFLAEEAVCMGSPTSSGCIGQDVAHNPVNPPEWLVHVSGGVQDLQAPTSQELDVIRARCAEACEIEWIDDPHIEANCNGLGAFDDPWLYDTPSIGARAEIPDAFVDGSGVFQGLSLGCDLLEPTGCCQTFAEDVCAAAPRRPTTAFSLIERNETYRVWLAGTNTKVTLTTPGDEGTAPMDGFAGYGFAEGSPPRGFYLGSLNVASTVPISLQDTCPDQTPFEVSVDTIVLDLLQPSFGIHGGDLDVGFPPGALHVSGAAQIGGGWQWAAGVNKEPVTGLVRGADVFEVSGLVLEFTVPCGNGELPVVATIDLERQGTGGRPPSGTITTSEWVPCNQPTTLSANVSDPEMDVDQIRWFVDDVLLDESVTAVQFYDGAVLKLRVRDERGATTVDTKTIQCIPMFGE